MGAGDPEPCLGDGVRAGGSDLCQGGEGGTDPSATISSSWLKGAGVQSTAGQACTLWVQAASPVPEGPGVTPPELLQEMHPRTRRMVAAARLALLLLGCVGLLQAAGESHDLGGRCFCSGDGREPHSSPAGNASCPPSLPTALPPQAPGT